jgi:hypothetical protein
MTTPTGNAPIPRLRILGYEYEARKGDLLIEPDGTTLVRITKVETNDEGTDLTLAGGEVRHYDKGNSIDMYRDMQELPENMREYEPSIVA